jgi:hypothetical protein
MASFNSRLSQVIPLHQRRPNGLVRGKQAQDLKRHMRADGLRNRPIPPQPAKECVTANERTVE